jgi:hypothetical protein
VELRSHSAPPPSIPSHLTCHREDLCSASSVHFLSTPLIRFADRFVSGPGNIRASEGAALRLPVQDTVCRASPPSPSSQRPNLRAYRQHSLPLFATNHNLSGGHTSGFQRPLAAERRAVADALVHRLPASASPPPLRPTCSSARLGVQRKHHRRLTTTYTPRPFSPRACGYTVGRVCSRINC